MPSDRYTMRSVSIPEDESVSFNSADDDIDQSVSIDTRTSASRFSTSRWPRFSQISINPTPRVSASEGPGEAFVRKEQGYGGVVDYRTPTLVKTLLSILSIVIILLGVVILYITTMMPDKIKKCENSRPRGTFIKLQHADKRGPFGDLTFQEYQSVLEYFVLDMKLNSTHFYNRSVDYDYVYMLEAMVPPKEEVMAYLNGLADKPDRKAKVTIVRGSEVSPVVEQYIVSPTIHPTSIETIVGNTSTDITTRLEDNARSILNRDRLYSTIIKRTVREISEILQNKLDTNCYEACSVHAKCCIELFQDSQNPAYYQKRSWAIMLTTKDRNSVNKLSGLRFLIDHSSIDISKWKVLELYIGDRLYTDMSDFISSVENSDSDESEEEIDVQSFDEMQDEPGYTNECLPDNRVFSIQDQQVFYRNWAFYYQLNPSHGLTIYDIRFERQQVVYEISLQSIELDGGNDHYERVIGESIKQLVPGFDCPSSATFIEAQIYIAMGSTAGHQRKAFFICVFESQNIQPSGTLSFNPYLTSVEEHVLIVRTVYNFGDSTYTLDYTFSEVGAIFTNMWYADHGVNKLIYESGRHMPAENISESKRMWTLFKIDMDVAGNENRAASFIPENENNFGRRLQPLKSERTTELSNETNIASNHVLVQSYNNATKDIGIREYHILSGQLCTNQDMPNKYGSKGRDSIIVSMYKYNETSLYPYIFGDKPATTVERLQTFVKDDDALIDEDIVLWMMQETTTGDFYNLHSAVCSFSVVPTYFQH